MSKQKCKDILKCRNGWENIYNPIIDEIIRHDNLQVHKEDKIGIKEVDSFDGHLFIAFVNPHNIPSKINGMYIDGINESKNTCEFCGQRKDTGFTISKDEKIVCCERCYHTYLENKPRTTRWMKNQK